MCQYKRLIYDCGHFALGRCINPCTTTSTRPCHVFTFPPMLSVRSVEICDKCEDLVEAMQAASRAASTRKKAAEERKRKLRVLLSGGKNGGEEENEGETKGEVVVEEGEEEMLSADEVLSVCSVDIANVTKGDV